MSTPNSLLSNNFVRLLESDLPFEHSDNKEKVFTFDQEEISSMQPVSVTHYSQAINHKRGDMSECFQSYQQNGNYYYNHNHNPNYLLGRIPSHTNLIHSQPLYMPATPYLHLHLQPFQSQFLPPEQFFPPYLQNYPNHPQMFLGNPTFQNPAHLSGSQFHGQPLSAIPEVEEQKIPGVSASSAGVNVLGSMSGASQTSYSANPMSPGEENPDLLLKGFNFF